MITANANRNRTSNVSIISRICRPRKIFTESRIDWKLKTFVESFFEVSVDGGRFNDGRNSRISSKSNPNTIEPNKILSDKVGSMSARYPEISGPKMNPKLLNELNRPSTVERSLSLAISVRYALEIDCPCFRPPTTKQQSTIILWSNWLEVIPGSRQQVVQMLTFLTGRQLLR